MKAHKLFNILFTYIVLALIVIVCLFPLIWMVLTSFKANIDIISDPFALKLSWATFVKNYDQVWNGRRFGLYIRNSAVVTAMTVLGCLLLAAPCAYGLSRFDFRRKNDLTFWILSQRFMPAIAVAVPIFLTINGFHLINTYTGLVLPYIAMNLPLAVWILRRFIDDIPRDLDQAALVDGAAQWQALWHIIRPLAMPGLVTTAILVAIFTWNEFLIGLFIVNTPDVQTVPIGASGLLSAERAVSWNIMTAVGTLTVMPVVIFSLFIQRYIVRGLTAGAGR
ncbi:MAG: carbohydrate ABC transporter permease [Caldilineaceae bacterium]